MSVKGNIKEAAGFIKEETGEKLKNDKMAYEGRSLREEGRAEDGKAPLPKPPGGGNTAADADKKAGEA